jgi:hypothetical protein
MFRFTIRDVMCLTVVGDLVAHHLPHPDNCRFPSPHIIHAWFDHFG